MRRPARPGRRRPRRRPLLVGDGERGPRAVAARLPPAGRHEPGGPAGRPARRLGLRPRRVARQRARARTPDPRSRRLATYFWRVRVEDAAGRLTAWSEPGAVRHRARGRVGLGRGTLDRLRGHAALRAHRARASTASSTRPVSPKLKRPVVPAAAARVRRAQARRAGAAVRERPRALRGVPQRGEGGRPIPRPGLDRLRRDRPLRRLRRDGAGAPRPERALRDRRERLPPRRAGALLQARGRLRLAEAPRRPPRSSTRTAAARRSAPAPPGRRRRPPITFDQHLRRRGLRRAARARGLDRADFDDTGWGRAAAADGAAGPPARREPITRCGSWRRCAPASANADRPGRRSLRLRPERLGHRPADRPRGERPAR